MAFDLYFAGSRTQGVDDWLAENEQPRLFSQLNDKKAIEAWNRYEKRGKLFIDSGAHSAHTKDFEVDVDAYIQYVNNLDDYVSIFAQVDKIPGVYRKPKTIKDWEEAPAKSWENFLYMHERLKSPDKCIPVFHQGENFRWLKTICDAKFDGKSIPYIGISPRGDVRVKDKEKFIAECFQIIEDSPNPDVKVHAFGMTTLEVLERYHFYSADSTTWLLTAAMGRIMTPWGLVYCSNRSKFETTPDQLFPAAKEAIFAYIKEMGYDYDQIVEDYVARMQINCRYLKNWADNYQHKPVNTRRKRLF